MKIDADNFYGASPFQSWVNKELNNRKGNVGLSDDVKTIMPSTKGDYGAPYKGPKTAWLRFISASSTKEHKGFQMFNHGGFEDLYGFNDAKSTTLGWDILGNPHMLPSGPAADLRRPPPAVISCATEMMGGDGGKFRKANLKLFVGSKFQLDYLTPYFLVPGISCFIEFGWNNYNPSSLIKFTKAPKVEKTKGNVITPGSGYLSRVSGWSNLRKAQEDSNGNYDSVVGIIKNYSYSLRGDGGFDVDLEIVQIGEAIYGVKSTQKVTVTKGEETSTAEDLMTFLDAELPKMVTKNDSKYTKRGIDPKGRTMSPETIKKITGQDPKVSGKGWISFDLLIDIINSFTEMKSGNTDLEFNKFNLANSFISSHPNLKSTNGSVLLIPNAIAPSFNMGKHADAEAESEKVEGSLKNATDAMNKALGTGPNTKVPSTNRVDLAQFITPDAYKGSDDEWKKQFPVMAHDLYVDLDAKSASVKVVSKDDGGMLYSEKGYFGWLGSLFVGIETIQSSFKGTETLLAGLNNLLQKMSSAGSDLWDFEVRPFDKDSQNSTTLSIVDKNFGLDVTKLKGNANLFKFNVLDNNSIAKNLTFGISLSDSVANQTIYSANVTEDTRAESTFFAGVLDAEDVTNDVVSNAEQNTPTSDIEDKSKKNAIVSGLSKYSEDAGYTVITNESPNQRYFRLAEPNAPLVNAVISADLSPNNNAVFNGLVPGVEVEVELLGISGIRFLDVFQLDGIPDNYAKNSMFQVKNVKHQLSDNMWTTMITAGLRPFPQTLIDFKEKNKPE